MMGKDVENWAGNYGARFRAESLKLIYSSQSKLENKIAAESTSISPINFSCDFNYGYGQSYYINGIQQFNHKWSNLSEFDFSLANQSQNGTYWPTFTGKHWIGGSSLILKEGSHTLQKYQKQEGQCKFKLVYQGNLTEIFGV